MPEVQRLSAAPGRPEAPARPDRHASGLLSRRLGALSSRRGARDAKHAGPASRRNAEETRARDDERAEERAERSGATKERPERQTFSTRKGGGKGGEDAEEVAGTDYPSDLSLLRRLSEKEVLRVLKARLMADTIYTTVNAMLIAVNPCHAVDGMYGPDQAAHLYLLIILCTVATSVAHPWI